MFQFVTENKYMKELMRQNSIKKVTITIGKIENKCMNFDIGFSKSWIHQNKNKKHQQNLDKLKKVVIIISKISYKWKPT